MSRGMEENALLAALAASMGRRRGGGDSESSVGAMLAELFGEDSDRAPRKAPMSEEESVRIGQQIAKGRAEPTTFKPGDVLRHRWPEHSIYKDPGKPRIFQSYLDTPFMGHDVDSIPMDAVNTVSAAEHYDCVLMTQVQGRLLTYLFYSRDWELHPDYSND